MIMLRALDGRLVGLATVVEIIVVFLVLVSLEIDLAAALRHLPHHLCCILMVELRLILYVVEAGWVGSILRLLLFLNQVFKS